MKITLIGPGIMSIPPKDYGGVESLIWDYKNELEKRGHDVTIINTKVPSELIEKANSAESDFVHLHYDVYAYIMPHLTCKNKAITSHYPYLEHPDKRGGYEWIFSDFALLVENERAGVIALSDSIKSSFVNEGIDPHDVYVVPCGINTELFKFRPAPKLPDRSIYLAKIEPRKRQFMLQHPSLDIDFAGPVADDRFNHENENYLGVLSKQEVYSRLTDYANLILFSDGEGHARVCIEGMAAGLGLVVSEQATSNLDTNKPFIDVIPDSKVTDTEFIKQTIEKNRETACSMRQEIRQYCVDEFGWDNIIAKYETVIGEISN